MPPQRNYSHIDTTLPVSRVGYSPVYEDDDRYDEEEGYSSMTPLPVVGASTRLLLPGGNSRRALSWGIAAAARKHSKWIRARWRRGELFSSNNGGASGAWEGGGGDWKETVKPCVISVLLSPVFHRFTQLALILTVVITTLLFVKYADKPPRKRYEDLDYTSLTPFNVTAVIERGDAVIWSSQKGLLGLDGNRAELGAYTVYLEMHTHTTHSDGDLSPQQVVDWAIAFGFNALVVSDHNTLTGALIAQSYANTEYNIDPRVPRILIIPAIEYTTCRIHLQLVGLRSPIPAPPAAFPTDAELRSIIDQTHAQGGLVIANHLPWSLSTERNYNVPTLQQHPSREQLLEWGVDAFEILHAGILDLPTLVFAKSHDMPLISSTDLHSPDEVPHGWTLMKDTPLTIPAILEKLKKGETSFASHPTGIGKTVLWPENNPEWDKWAPLVGMDFGFLYEEFHGMYSFTGEWCHERKVVVYKGRAMWFVIWTALAWGVYEGVRWGTALGWGWVARRRDERKRNRGIML